MTFKMRGQYSWPSYRTLEMADPLGFTQELAQPVFDSSLEFADLLDGLESLSALKAMPLNALAVN